MTPKSGHIWVFCHGFGMADDYPKAKSIKMLTSERQITTIKMFVLITFLSQAEKVPCHLAK